ncbi:MAG: ubiquinone/menaquinone biosynthesis methyltransferase [Chloroflexi bacterium]|nr:ubiquinone/menaquinone biosynthesis methyltransferase [Chloroflexota bacterium]
MTKAIPLGSNKARYIQEMFAQIAPIYDRVNSWISWRRDGVWRRRAVEEVGILKGKLVLDVGAGTGGLAAMAAGEAIRVVAVDLCRDMLLKGQAKFQNSKHNPTWVLGDGTALPFNEGSFHCVMSSFVLRNVFPLQTFLGEVRRVLKPGGVVVFLELATPPHKGLASLHGLYLKWGVPLFSRWLGGSADAYHYLVSSIQAFPAAEHVKALMEQQGFRHVNYRHLDGGIVFLQKGYK